MKRDNNGRKYDPCHRWQGNKMDILYRKIRNDRCHSMAGLLCKQTQRAWAAVVIVCIMIMIMSKRN